MKTAVVVGCGKMVEGKEGWAIGHAHARGYLEAFPEIALYGVDIDEENLQAFGAKFNLPPERLFRSTQALYDALTPEMLSVCTWPALHHAQVIEAANRGVKAITCEKPMALDGSEIQEMLRACRKKGARLAIAHQRCYEWPYRKAKELLHSGVLGEKRVLEARVGDDWDILSWTVHWFDMANWLFDAQPQWVLAGLDHTGNRRYRHAVENASLAFAQYPNDQAIFITGPEAIMGTGISIKGEKGLLKIGKEVVVYAESGVQRFTMPEPQPNSFGLLFLDLAKGVKTGGSVECDAERTALATLMAFAVHESARTQKKIFLPHPIGYAPLEVLQHPSQPKIPQLGHIVLCADAHHYERDIGLSGRDGLIAALQSYRPEKLTVVEAEKEALTSEHLAQGELLVLYHTIRKSTPETRQALTQWVKSGKPLVIAHCGIGAYSDWPEYKAWLGRHWVWSDEDPVNYSGHPHVPCEIELLDETFQVPWKSAWLPRDEVYVKLATTQPVKEIAKVRYPDGEAPIAWQNRDYPNVVVWCPGHRPDCWTLPVMLDGLLASMLRAVQLE